MLEEQKAWKRELGCDRIETAAEMDEKYFHISPVSEPFFYNRNMSNPRRPHTPDEFTLEKKVDVKQLRMEILLLQPAPPQCHPLPRRLLAADTGSEEPGTPRRSPAIGTGSDEPGVSRDETSTETKEIFCLESSIYVFLHSNCTSPEQEGILLQPDVGVDDKKDTTATTQQAAVCEECARSTKKRQQQKRTAWTTNQSKQSTGVGQQREIITFLKREMFFRILFCLFFPLCLPALYFCIFPVLSAIFLKQVRKAIGVIGMYQMRELLYQGRSVYRHLDLHIEGYSLYYFVFWMLCYEYCFFFDCIAFELVGQLPW